MSNFMDWLLIRVRFDFETGLQPFFKVFIFKVFNGCGLQNKDRGYGCYTI